MMTASAPIPEGLIMYHLNLLLTTSKPGAMVHHLHVASAPPSATTPLGLIDEAALQSAIYAIAPVGDIDVHQFIAHVIARAATEARNRGHVIRFAALSQEIWSAPADDVAQRLMREGKLPKDHPDAAEATLVYGASCDGRRWCGQRWLTGPRAGEVEQANLIVGRPRRDEAHSMPAAQLLRQLVGLAA